MENQLQMLYIQVTCTIAMEWSITQFYNHTHAGRFGGLPNRIKQVAGSCAACTSNYTFCTLAANGVILNMGLWQRKGT